ncbi:MAG TPA: c-type cytochrome [Candidatus Acidoferrum sp.]|jgi:cytochrome c oxidase cbb3-type subunit 3|nr:c-type cytochrome [Candidatus Acidoferrum sp.]
MRNAMRKGIFNWKWAGIAAACLVAAYSPHLSSQTGSGGNATVGASKAAISGSHEDPAAVARGETAFQSNCGGCHGMTAKGTDHGPDLIRSNVLIDDDHGSLLTPVIRDGSPEKGMPKSTLSADQLSDVVAWLHAQFYAADHRTTYSFLSVLTGDPKRGEAYFNGAAKCNTCHSPSGDLAGIGGKYDPHVLQQRWLQPRGAGFARGGGAVAGRAARTVAVTLPSGETVSGTLDRIDDFYVSLHDSSGELRTFERNGNTPKVVVTDPLQAHLDLLKTYTDAEIHDITAYLVTLK